MWSIQPVMVVYCLPAKTHDEWNGSGSGLSPASASFKLKFTALFGYKGRGVFGLFGDVEHKSVILETRTLI